MPFFWRFHKIHHLDEFLDVTTALRFHFGEVLLSTFFRAIIIIIFDISWMSIICFEILVLFSSAFHHSNIRIPEFLDKIVSKRFITSSIHGIHHHAIDRDTNSNYSTIFNYIQRLEQDFYHTKFAKINSSQYYRYRRRKGSVLNPVVDPPIFFQALINFPCQSY